MCISVNTTCHPHAKQFKGWPCTHTSFWGPPSTALMTEAIAYHINCFLLPESMCLQHHRLGGLQISEIILILMEAKFKFNHQPGQMWWRPSYHFTAKTPHWVLTGCKRQGTTMGSLCKNIHPIHPILQPQDLMCSQGLHLLTPASSRARISTLGFGGDSNIQTSAPWIQEMSGLPMQGEWLKCLSACISHELRNELCNFLHVANPPELVIGLFFFLSRELECGQLHDLIELS